MLKITGLLGAVVLILAALSFNSTGRSIMETKTTLKIGMVGIYVDDPEKAFKFYTEKVGFVKVLFMPEAKLAIVASPLEPQGTALLLEPNENPTASRYQKELYKAGIPVIVFTTENLLAEYERLKKLGLKFKQEPTTSEWGIQAVFDDTCGNWVQLHQPLK